MQLLLCLDLRRLLTVALTAVLALRE